MKARSFGSMGIVDNLVATKRPQITKYIRSEQIDMDVLLSQQSQAILEPLCNVRICEEGDGISWCIQGRGRNRGH